MKDIGLDLIDSPKMAKFVYNDEFVRKNRGINTKYNYNRWN